jgi:hypothetical protein
VLLSFCWNLVTNLKLFWVQSFRFIDRSKTFWTSIITKPNPNSTADKIKKKNVNDRRFKLSKTRPLIRVSMYSVIHKNSAVSSKCKDVFTLIVILEKSIKNKSIIKLISPNVIIYCYIVKTELFSRRIDRWGINAGIIPWKM